MNHPTNNANQENTPREILVVDDDPVFRLLHQRLLEKEEVDSQINACANGQEALERLEAEAGEDREVLVLLDLNMPVMDGWEFLEQCRKKNLEQQAPVVIVSSSSNGSDKEKAAEYDQVVSYCNKPFNKASLASIKGHTDLRPFF